jgi:hypothetical protein
MCGKNTIVYNIMSSAALSSAKARRSVPNGVDHASGEIEYNGSEAGSLRNVKPRQRTQPKLPPIWEVLTCHDKDLKMQQSQNEKFSAQVIDLIEVVSSVQEQIDKLTNLNLQSKFEEISTRIDDVETTVRTDKANLPVTTKKSKSAKN